MLVGLLNLAVFLVGMVVTVFLGVTVLKSSVYCVVVVGVVVLVVVVVGKTRATTTTIDTTTTTNATKKP